MGSLRSAVSLAPTGERRDHYPPIADHGLIGDLEAARWGGAPRAGGFGAPRSAPPASHVPPSRRVITLSTSSEVPRVTRSGDPDGLAGLRARLRVLAYDP
jgi:hypothetical protein